MLLQLRVFATAPSGDYQQELNQSPLLFRESSVSPDQEERIRRKDAIIQTRNAQVPARCCCLALMPAHEVICLHEHQHDCRAVSNGHCHACA